MIYLSTHVKGILKHRAGVEKKLIVLWSFPCYAMGWLVTVVYFPGHTHPLYFEVGGIRVVRHILF